MLIRIFLSLISVTSWYLCVSKFTFLVVHSPKKSLFSISPPRLCLVGRISFQFFIPSLLSGWNKLPVMFVPCQIEFGLTISLQSIDRVLYISRIEKLMTENARSYSIEFRFSIEEKVCLMDEESSSQQLFLKKFLKEFVQQQVVVPLFQKLICPNQVKSLFLQQVAISPINPWLRSLL